MSQITQRGATGPLAIFAGGAFQTTTDTNILTLVGTRWDLEDGREVILVSNGTATATVAGDLYQDAAVVPNHQGLTTTAFTAWSANGNTPAQITVTLGNTAATANQYQGGFLYVQSGVGIGQTLLIASHPAAVGSASLVITLEDNPTVALTTASVVSLWPAHGYGVIINPTTPTNAPCGIALYAIPVSTATVTYYGFLLAKGLTAALSDSTAPAVGHAIASSTTTAGTIGAVAYTGSVVTGTVIGNTVYAATSAAANMVYLNL